MSEPTRDDRQAAEEILRALRANFDVFVRDQTDDPYVPVEVVARAVRTYRERVEVAAKRDALQLLSALVCEAGGAVHLSDLAIVAHAVGAVQWFDDPARRTKVLRTTCHTGGPRLRTRPTDAWFDPANWPRVQPAEAALAAPVCECGCDFSRHRDDGDPRGPGCWVCAPEVCPRYRPTRTTA